MSAITAALRQLDDVAAAEGDLAPTRLLVTDGLELEPPGIPIVLPDGRRIARSTRHAAPVDGLALAPLHMDDPAESSFLPLSHRPARARPTSPRESNPDSVDPPSVVPVAKNTDMTILAAASGGSVARMSHAPVLDPLALWRPTQGVATRAEADRS
jgi:hypothetical protein